MPTLHPPANPQQPSDVCLCLPKIEFAEVLRAAEEHAEYLGGSPGRRLQRSVTAVVLVIAKSFQWQRQYMQAIVDDVNESVKRGERVKRGELALVRFFRKELERAE